MSSSLLNKIVMPAIVMTLTGITFFSCTKEVGKIAPTCNTPDVPSFSRDILPIFNTSCSISGCHSGTNPTGNLNLEASVAYTKLSKHGSGYLDTINPGSSLLYSQMISSSDPMPPTGRLDDCKTALILKWIQQKTKNN